MKRAASRLRAYCLAIAALAAAALPMPAAAQVVGSAARVNGVDISVFRLERHFEEFMQERRRDPAAIRSPNVYKRLKGEALDELIDRELLCQYGRRAGLAVPAAEIDAALAAFKARFNSEELLARRLREAGFDLESYREYLACDLLARRSFIELAGEVTVDEEKVHAYLARYRDRFVLPERVHARHILRRVANPREQADARKLIDELHQKALDGADFAGLAREYSEDATRERGGDLGEFSFSQMVPEFARAAFALAPGEISAPVRSRFGWHLIRVESRRAAEPMPEGEALARARALLEGEQRLARGRERLKSLREAADIERLLAL